ncbi:hypothetical protein NMG60_11026466 [Bertholletia excelsa]
MNNISYKKVARRSGHGRRCFRLNLRRFSVQRLRAKFMCLFRLFNGWRSCCRRSSQRNKERDGRRNFAATNDYRMIRSYSRSNSFYSEAIADCLEFIKRSSISLDEYKSIDQI